ETSQILGYDPKPNSYFSGLGCIPISTPQELALIGNDAGYPLDGNYYLANDIIFTSADDTNGGTDIEISAIVTGTTLTVTLTPSDGTVSSLYAWLGMVSADSVSNAVTLMSIPQGTYTLVVGGILESGGSDIQYAYSIEINTASNGEKADKTFSSNGNFTPIGSPVDPFTGIFNGNGHEISGMKLAAFDTGTDREAVFGMKGFEDMPDTFVGMFGFALGAQICNIGLVDGSVTMASLSVHPFVSAGSIVGMAAGFAESTLSAEEFTEFMTSLVESIASEEEMIEAIEALYVSSIKISQVMIIENCYNTGSVTTVAYELSKSDDIFPSAGGVIGMEMSELSTTAGGAGIVELMDIIESLIKEGLMDPILVPTCRMTVKNCYNAGCITAPMAGGIIGESAGATQRTITGCHNIGDVRATASRAAYAGGVVGSMLTQRVEQMTVTECYNEGSVTAESLSIAVAGGVVGLGLLEKSIIVTKCYNIGEVSASSSVAYVGGVVGDMDANFESSTMTIAECYNEGSVTAESSLAAVVGGVVGNVGGLYGSLTTTIADCYNSGSIAATASSVSLGGVIGTVYNTLTMKNCYNSGSVTATVSSLTYAGGLFGYTAGEGTITILSCYFLEERIWVNGSMIADVICGDGLPVVDGYSGVENTIAMQEQATYYGWDFVNIWDMDEEINDGYPILRASSEVVTYTVTLPTGTTGYSVTAYGSSSSPVEYGGSFTFQFSRDAGYSGGTVSVNGIPVTLDGNGRYTITDITSDQNVTVSGVTKNSQGGQPSGRSSDGNGTLGNTDTLMLVIAVIALIAIVAGALLVFKR
ncbi:MAG: hypothetical protein FWH44_02580, partial [Methanomassiliicoccaceae archaeon]|nr:hypothetical protein [Methanomassiliicoccaceae archaeon]